MAPDYMSGDDLPCKLKVGFLFKRTCGRTDRTGCDFCKGKPQPVNTDMWQSGYDPYFNDRSMYGGYGTYDRGYWASDYHTNTYNDFTDGDTNAVAASKDSDFEQRLDGS